MLLMQSLPAEYSSVSSETTGQKIMKFALWWKLNSRFISKLNVLFTLYFALIKCDLEVMYGVYVVEQDGNTPFNRAMLMNVGAAEAVKQQVFITLPMFSLEPQLLRTSSASYSTTWISCQRTTGTCTPVRYNRGTCPCPSTASSIGFLMMISSGKSAL